MLIEKRPATVGCGRRVLGSCRASILVMAVGFFASGCDTATETFTRAAIKGSVTLDDQPLDGASIRFIPIDDTIGPKTEFPIVQGEFSATRTQGPPIGNHRVEIDWVDQAWQHDDEQALEKLSQSPRAKISRPTLPDRYHQRSTLTATVDAADDDAVQRLTFPLTSRTR
jgi:hypothetical protein